MESSYSPPILYLADEDDDTEPEPQMSHINSIPPMYDDHYTRKRRRFSSANVHINPSLVDWSKRQRYNNYHQLPTTYNAVNYEPVSGIVHPNEYYHREPESHSFLAFDWASKPETSSRIYSNSIHTHSRASFPPRSPPTIMNVTKHHLDHCDSVPMMHQNDTYMHSSPRKFKSTPFHSNSSPPPLSLPLPTPTSSIMRPMAQRVQPGKSTRIPYSHSSPPPPPPPPPPSVQSPLQLSAHYQTESVFQARFRPPSPVSILNHTAKLEIRREPLNGTGILSAFYDSKCYRCNICKFKSTSSTIILQHIFTHMFFCPHCSFYTYTHHSLYLHVHEMHQLNLYHNDIDPKDVDLLYLTRCADGSLALCMDTSTAPVPSPPSPVLVPPSRLPSPVSATNEQNPTTPQVNKPKRRGPKRKIVKQQKDDDEDIVILSEKNNKISKPSSSSLATVTKRLLNKERQTPAYVLMKHRRCFSIRHPPCLHALTLEYNICREHTIRQMCHTHGLMKRRKFKLKLTASSIIEEVARCLKTVVNNVVSMEDNKDSFDLICALPNNVINSTVLTDNFSMIMSALKLTNKHDINVKQIEQYTSEHNLRRSNQHTFILSSAGMTKNDQSVFALLHSSVTSDDSPFTRTNIENLIMPIDNTQRFLKVPRRQSTTKSTKKSTNNTKESTNLQTMNSVVTKSSQQIKTRPTFPQVDRNNNAITSSESKSSSANNVIVID